MKPLPSNDLSALNTYQKSLAAVEQQVRLLIDIVKEAEYPFTDADREQLASNIRWLKRYYEAAERNLLDGNR